MTTYISMDLIANILSRLPVKSLLRFRCVGKAWRSLIDDDRHFIKSHLDRSIKTKNNLTVMISYLDIYSVPFDSLDDVAVELDWPFKYSIYKTQLFGCCYGLVCLGVGDENAAIWNPTTRKYRKLPDAPIDIPEDYTGKPEIAFDMGYDSVTDDYKVVRIVNFGYEKYVSEVRVYSMKLNAWRRVRGFPRHFSIGRQLGREISVLVCSSLHWMVNECPNYEIVAFDLAAEEHRLMPKPKCDDLPDNWILRELEGCLCVLYNNVGFQLDVWMMKDYGVKESWSRVFSVHHEFPPVLSFEVVIPLSYSKCGRKVLMVEDSETLVWFDVEQQTREDTNTLGLPDHFFAKICVESLVSVSGGYNGGTKLVIQQKRKNKKRKKNR